MFKGPRCSIHNITTNQRYNNGQTFRVEKSYPSGNTVATGPIHELIAMCKPRNHGFELDPHRNTLSDYFFHVIAISIVSQNKQYRTVRRKISNWRY